VPDHVIHGDWQGAVVTQHGHAQAVTDQDHLDASLFLQVGSGEIITGQPGDGTTLGDFLEQVRQCDFLAGLAFGSDISFSFGK